LSCLEFGAVTSVWICLVVWAVRGEWRGWVAAAHGEGNWLHRRVAVGCCGAPDGAVRAEAAAAAHVAELAV